MRQHHTDTRPRTLSRRRGFTLLELMIAISISTLVVSAVISLQYITAKNIKDLYGQTRTRSSRMIALDKIRYRLTNAKVGTCVVSNANHRIEFKDPNLGGVTSTFYFSPDTRTLFYDRNISDGSTPDEIVSGPIDVTFQLQEPNNLGFCTIILLKVRSSSDTSCGDVDLQDGNTSIYLRNI
jgi:prepilin-type N-terminal cleavage/methylation domain-containing protein